MLVSALTDLLSSLAAAPEMYNIVVAETFPPLVEILGQPIDESQSWFVVSALDLIVSVLEGGEKGKLGVGFVAALAPPLFDCLGRAQDRDITVVSDLYISYTTFR